MLAERVLAVMQHRLRLPAHTGARVDQGKVKGGLAKKLKRTRRAARTHAKVRAAAKKLKRPDLSTSAKAKRIAPKFNLTERQTRRILSTHTKARPARE